MSLGREVDLAGMNAAAGRGLCGDAGGRGVGLSLRSRRSSNGEGENGGSDEAGHGGLHRFASVAAPMAVI